MIPQISAGQNNNDWLRKKLLERQAQQSAAANSQPQQIDQNNRQIQEQSNGTNQAQNINQASGAISANNMNYPWGNFMSSIGLSSQGSKDADMSAIGEKLSVMKAQATDPTQKTQIESLEKQYEGYKAVAANMSANVTPNISSSPNEKSTAAENMTGATQLGEYNKLFIKKFQPGT
jgi:hypothetical protein